MVHTFQQLTAGLGRQGMEPPAYIILGSRREFLTFMEALGHQVVTAALGGQPTVVEGPNGKRFTQAEFCGTKVLGPTR
tara:strand:+ start:743 stop:976 length:234 start_codon:yes stop_codon:yes gene_type:complete